MTAPTCSASDRLAELKRLAERATQGKWIFYQRDPSQYPSIMDAYNDEILVSTACGFEEQNAEYVIAANPQTVLMLLDAIEEMRGTLDLIQKIGCGACSCEEVARESLAKVDALLGEGK